jgi:hypothetical protein
VSTPGCTSDASCPSGWMCFTQGSGCSASQCSSFNFCAPLCP